MNPYLNDFKVKEQTMKTIEYVNTKIAFYVLPILTTCYMSSKTPSSGLLVLSIIGLLIFQGRLVGSEEVRRFKIFARQNGHPQTLKDLKKLYSFNRLWKMFVQSLPFVLVMLGTVNLIFPVL